MINNNNNTVYFANTGIRVFNLCCDAHVFVDVVMIFLVSCADALLMLVVSFVDVLLLLLLLLLLLFSIIIRHLFVHVLLILVVCGAVF